MKIYIISLLLLLYNLYSYAQEISLKEKGYIDVVLEWSPLSIQDYLDIPKEKKIEWGKDIKLRNFESTVLVFKAWNLIGELALNPIFYWELDRNLLQTSTRSVHFNQISKYPDLVKRYQAIMPTSISSILVLKLLPAGKYVTFKLTDNDLGYSNSRAISFPVCPGSPLKWKNSMSVSYIQSDQFTEADPTEERVLKKILSEAEAVSLPNEIYSLKFDVKWPENEINEIAILYEKYEKGIIEPSPLKEVQNKQSEVNSLPQYTKNDFWSEPAEIPIKVDLDKNLNNTTTSEGVVKISGKVSGPESLIKQGRIIAEGYEQNFDVNSSGQFNIQVVLGSGLNKIKVVVGSKVIEQEITLARAPVDLRATLTWNTGGSDIDLYIVDPEKFSCNYRNISASNMRLDVDNTSGFGPENIYVAKVKKGTYTISAKNYRGGENTEATIYVFINEKLRDVHKIRFNSNGESIIVSKYNF